MKPGRGVKWNGVPYMYFKAYMYFVDDPWAYVVYCASPTTTTLAPSLFSCPLFLLFGKVISNHLPFPSKAAMTSSAIMTLLIPPFHFSARSNLPPARLFRAKMHSWSDRCRTEIMRGALRYRACIASFVMSLTTSRGLRHFTGML